MTLLQRYLVHAVGLIVMVLSVLVGGAVIGLAFAMPHKDVTQLVSGALVIVAGGGMGLVLVGWAQASHLASPEDIEV